MNLMQNYLSNQTNTDQSYEEAMLKQYGNYADRTSALGSQQREENNARAVCKGRAQRFKRYN